MMAITRMLPFLYRVFVMLLFLLHVGNCMSIRRTLDGFQNPPMTIEEIGRDYFDWISRVGSKNHSIGVRDVKFFLGNVITVAKTGKTDFTTVQAAVNSVPDGNSGRVVIHIASGVYREKVNVPRSKPYITFQGAGSAVTKITWNDTATSAGSTYNSYSVAVNSDYFIATNISFENSAPAPPPGAAGMQAVALRISADKAQFHNCGFYGAQDTLFDDIGRHYFKNCIIQGSIDIICGDGQSVYEGCELYATAVTYGSLTAQSRSSPGENTGYTFLNCTITGSGIIYLGRAWGAYSRVVYLNSFIDNIIIPQGWYDWGDPSRDKTVFYGQYKCSGPGAKEQGRVTWSRELTDAQAAPFLSLTFIDGSSWVQ